MRLYLMFVTAVCVLFLIKNFYWYFQKTNIKSAPPSEQKALIPSNTPSLFIIIIFLLIIIIIILLINSCYYYFLLLFLIVACSTCPRVDLSHTTWPLLVADCLLHDLFRS